MLKTTLSDSLREKISNLIDYGMSTIDIYDLVMDDETVCAESGEDVILCISLIRGKGAFKNNTIKTFPEKKYKNPELKRFNMEPHRDIVTRLNTVMTEKNFNDLCEPVVIDILHNYEGFIKTGNANVMPDVKNPLFDYLAFKGKTPYLIEFKGSLYSFNSPCEVHKRRLKELKECFDGLKGAILQVRINTGEYRIFYNNEMNLFFDGRKVSIAPVVQWIENRLNH